MNDEEKVPNPYGKKGGKLHQLVVEVVAKEVESKGLFARIEYLIRFITGKKRYIDVAGLNEEQDIVELHQIGKQTKKGLPVKRERNVIQEIIKEKGITTSFHPYNFTNSEDSNEE